MDSSSATFAARRAADMVAVLQNKERLEYRALIIKINKVLKRYGENTEMTTVDLDELKAVSHKLYPLFVTQYTAKAVTILNALLQEYAGQPRLNVHNASWHVHTASADDAS